VKAKSTRYNLTVNSSQGADLLRISESHHVSIVDIIRRFCVLGILEDRRGPFFYRDEHGAQKEIELFPKKEDRKLQLWKREVYDSVLSSDTPIA
jgi:hypothetical protein